MSRLTGIRLLTILLLTATGCGTAESYTTTSAPLTTTTTNDGNTLADTLLSSGSGAVRITNVQYTGADSASATYTDGPLGIADGILLTTGSAQLALPPSDSESSTQSSGLPGSPLCEQLIPGHTSYDAAVLSITFDLAPGYDGISFQSIFGSEEYPEFVNSPYNDIYGVFLNGQQIAFDANGELITINGPFFSSGNVIAEPATMTEYDGSTDILTTQAELQGGSTNNVLQFVICDVGDDAYDSGVFLSWLGGCVGSNCSGTAPCDQIDNDNDGVNACTDCNDANPSIHPGAAEVCDEADNNCDGSADEGLFCDVELSCDAEVIPRPAPALLSGLGWSMIVEVSDDDGLVVRDVSLGTRYMAEEMSLPYIKLNTSELSLIAPIRVELKPNGSDPTARSRLVDFQIDGTGADKIYARATYVVDRIPEGSNSCVSVTQRYEFEREKPTGGCEPSQFVGPFLPHNDPLPCSPFRPAVDYEFYSLQSQDATISFESAQRLRLRDEHRAGNTARLFEDSDTPFTDLGVIWSSMKLTKELDFPYFAIFHGQKGETDSYHQTYRSDAEAPTDFPVGPGCPECIHIHWRWSKAAGWAYGGPNGPGTPLLVHPDSTQTVQFAAVYARSSEADPDDFKDLLDGEALANKELAFWYSGESTRQSDTFFEHGGFFSTLSKFADLKVTQTASASQVAIGQEVTYTIAVTNNGPAEDIGTVLGIGWSDVGYLQRHKTTTANLRDSGTNHLVYVFDKIKPGKSQLIKVVLMRDLGESPTLWTSATVGSSMPDPNPDNNAVELSLPFAP